MASTFSPILRIELIGTGDQSGTWGNTTNVNLGTLIEQAIAGTATIDVTSANVTLTDFNGATDEARCMALRITGTPGTSRNVIAPTVSKIYVVANGSDAAVVLKTSVSTGLTIPVGQVYLAYYDTTTADFRMVGQAIATANTANTLVLRDASGNFTAGTITANLTGNVTGTLTGTIASSTVATTQSSGDSTTKVATTAFVGTAITNATSSLGTMASQNANNVTITGGSITGITDLAVADGGTGSSSLTANAVLLGNDTSALQTVAPGTSGNVLTSNGTTWASTAPAGGIGIGQTWQDVTGSRALGTTYTNSTGKPIMVVVTNYNGGANGVFLQITVAGVQILTNGGWPGGANAMYATGSVIVPNGSTYSASNSGGGGLNRWVELR
jgi:hypothetical protein